MKLRLDMRVVKIAVCLVTVLALFLGGMLLLRAWEEADRITPPASTAGPIDGEERELTWYQDGWYARREGQELTLILGIDNFTDAEESGKLGERIFTQSDFILLLVTDKLEKTCTALQLNRDTMTNYRLLSDAGKVIGKRQGQLTMAHAYGGTEKLRCENSVEAVSGLLYGLPIDHYISLTMDAVSVLNDKAGGVTVEVMDDLTALDPALAEGRQVKLLGEQALTYIRSRRGLADETNLRRMERQRQYLEALQAQVEACTKDDDGFLLEALLAVNPYMTSDCTVEQLSALARTVEEYGLTRTLTPEGEAVKGEQYTEFHVDEAALRALVMELFYQRVENG